MTTYYFCLIFSTQRGLPLMGAGTTSGLRHLKPFSSVFPAASFTRKFISASKMGLYTSASFNRISTACSGSETSFPPHLHDACKLAHLSGFEGCATSARTSFSPFPKISPLLTRQPCSSLVLDLWARRVVWAPDGRVRRLPRAALRRSVRRRLLGPALPLRRRRR